MKPELHLEVLSEDRSGCVVLQSLITGILKNERQPFTLALRAHRGKGKALPIEDALTPPPFSSGLLDLLPAKLKAYDEVYAGRRFVAVVVMDSDSDAPRSVYNTVRDMCRRYAPSLPHAIGISVEEIESWLLADERAILAAYPQADLSQKNNYIQDSVCGTWEVLARVLLGDRARELIRIGYPAVGQYKQEWANRISAHLNPADNRSPSFHSFRKEILRSVATFPPETEAKPT